MNEFLQDLGPNLDLSRALDVAAGDGQFTSSFLSNKYAKVDCFDQCMFAVRKLENLWRRVITIDRVDQAEM